MSLFFRSIVEKITNVIDAITGAKKARKNNTAITDVIKDIQKQPDSISSILGTTQALAGGIDPNYYPRISGNNKLKGIIFTKLINETNAIIDEANLEKKKMIKNG